MQWNKYTHFVDFLIEEKMQKMVYQTNIANSMDGRMSSVNKKETKIGLNCDFT